MGAALNLHDQDFYAWTQEQARLIKDNLLGKLDLIHLQEELISMGASERRELDSRLSVLLMHLLKWKYQPARQCKSWIRTIKIQRIEVIKHLKSNPSLRAVAGEYLLDAYDTAILKAAEETNLDDDVFPTSCEWTIDQVLDDNFYPN